jgi:PEP-CTERM motif
MKIKNLLAGVVATGALALATQAAQAAIICAGCEYDDASAGTHIGLYNPTTFDLGTFQHSDVGTAVGGNTPFEDFWVFDVDPAGNGSMSADFTAFTSISGFSGELYTDGGSTCAAGTPGSCSNIVLGALIGSDVDAGARRWEIIADGLAAGRYIIRVTGTTNGNGTSTSAYTGQLAFGPLAVPEPGTLALLGLGILGMGLATRRR